MSYSSIAANTVTFEAGMRIDVKASASPIIYPLKTALTINSLSIKGSIEGKLNLNGKLQGEKYTDDFLLRIGLVYQGDKRLGFLQRKLAPAWVKKLHRLAPKDSGIDRIEFYNMYSDPALQGKHRTHPASDLLKEHFVIAEPAGSDFNASFPVSSKTPVVALWISSDGDDTDSAYSVTLEEITLHAELDE